MKEIERLHNSEIILLIFAFKIFNLNVLFEFDNVWYWFLQVIQNEVVMCKIKQTFWIPKSTLIITLNEVWWICE